MSRQNWGNHAIHLGLALGVVHSAREVRVQRLRAEKADRLDDARDDYYRSLRALENAVNGEGLKEEAFIQGIVYAGLMRDAGKDSEFDEERVVEEIQRLLRLGTKVVERDSDGALARLQELEAVREVGLISQEEYHDKRAEILASI